MKKGSLLTGLFLTIACYTSAQHLYFQTYQPLGKNEAVRVNRFLQSASGYLWLGTDKGLFRFDGTDFRRYQQDTLLSKTITALAEDSLHRIWIGLQSGEIAYLDGDAVVPFAPEGIGHAPVLDIHFGQQGVLWFATQNDGLYYYSKDRLYRVDDVEGLPDLYVYDIAESTDGAIWACTDGGLAYCKITNGQLSIQTYSSPQGLPDNIVKKILPDGKQAWLITEDAGLVRMAAGKFSVVLTNTDFGAVADVVRRGSFLWVTTEQGIVVLTESGGVVQRISQHGASQLFVDQENNVWLSLKNGFVRTAGNQIQIIDGPAGLQNAIAVAANQQGKLWFSTDKGLYQYSATGVTRLLENTPFARSNVISLYVDEEGFLWAGLYDDGVIRIDPETRKIQSFRKELANGSVLHISGKGHKVWLATLGGATEIDFSGSKTTVKNFNVQNGLSTDYIYQVFPDSKGRLWFATDRAGIDMLDPSGLHHYRDSLRQKVIFGFAEDAQGRIWANVQGDGLYYFNDTQFVPFEYPAFFRRSNINSLTADKLGRLIVMTDIGIDVYDPATQQFKFFDEAYGIRDMQPNLNAVAFNGNDLWIGTTAGIIYLGGSVDLTRQPHAVINTLLVNDKPVSIKASHTLPYDENTITIKFTGLWYQNPGGLIYRYKLDNLEDKWTETRERTLSFSRLEPGEYVFHLQVSDSYSFAHAEEVVVKLTIKPPFWRTAWFYIVVILLSGTAIYVFVRWRERRLVEEKRVLEERVRERTREIENKTHEIQAQAEEIKGINENLEALVQNRTRELERKNKALEEYAFINAHELRAPVASILGLINLMKKMELAEEDRIYLQHMDESARKLDDVVRSITEAIERGDYGTAPGESSDLE